MAGVVALKFALHLPSSFAILDSKSRWMRAMKCCPACGSTLLTFHEKHGEIQTGKTGTIGGGHKHSHPGRNVTKNLVYDENITSWYCPKCGVQIIPDQTDEISRNKNNRLSSGDIPPIVNNPTTPAAGKPPLAPRQVAKRRSEGGSRENLIENQPLKSRPSNDVVLRMNQNRNSLTSSPQSPGGSSIIDEPYLAFEQGIQDGLTALLNHIRNHLMQKEGQLREYQVDMLHREKTLKANEQDFVVRITRLEQSEKSLKNKRERLQMYKDTMMYQLDAKAKQLAKFENRQQWNNQMSDIEHSTQNDSSGLSNNSSANPALPPRQSRDNSVSNRTSSILENDTQRNHMTYQPRPQSNTIVNDGRTSYHPAQPRYSNGINTHTFRLSFTGPSSGSSQPNSVSYANNVDDRTNIKGVVDPKWRRSDPNPMRVVTTTASSIPVQQYKKIAPSDGGVKDSEGDQTGVLHVDTGYYSVRQGEQKRSGSYSTYHDSASTPSLLQVDDERWKQQKGNEDHKTVPEQQHVVSHEQLDRRYYPGYENRRSFDFAEPPMKESPRQAWMRSRQRIENAQQQSNTQKHQQQQLQVYKPSVQIERQQPPKSWNSSPNINQVNSSFDELPESHRMNSSHENLLEPEMPRGSRDSLLVRNLSVTDVQVSSPTSPPPAYNGHAGPPLPKAYHQNHAQYTQVTLVNGYSPPNSNDEATRYDHYYHSRDYRHYSPGSRAYLEEQVAPRHMRRVTEL